MVQRVARPPAVSAKRPPTAEDRLSESLLGLSLGAKAGLIDVMVNHAGQSRCPKLPAPPAAPRSPRWDGSTPLAAGEELLLVAEQGLGDAGRLCLCI